MQVVSYELFLIPCSRLNIVHSISHDEGIPSVVSSRTSGAKSNLEPGDRHIRSMQAISGIPIDCLVPEIPGWSIKVVGKIRRHGREKDE